MSEVRPVRRSVHTSVLPSVHRSIRRAPSRCASLALTLVVGILLAFVGSFASTTNAWAAGAISVVNDSGAATADPDYATDMTVTGNGFQSIQGGFGGIYVLFGWIDAGSAWQPSKGGTVGTDYRYVPDSESKDNAGYQRFVSFPGSDTEASANAVMAANGSFSVDVVIPGAIFESQDRNGDVSEVDCEKVQCGIITIGAHGVKNANNESFTPISFVAPAAAGAATGSAAAATAPATSSGVARVGYTTASAVAGNALSFTGQGFAAGEQVVATLDNGVAAVGPLTAGASGEVAGVLPLPIDLRGGTHLLVLSGAASGSTAQTEVSITADLSTAATPVAEISPPVWPYILLGIGILLALVLLIVSVATSIVRARRSRRAKPAVARNLSADVTEEVLTGANYEVTR
jgi:hypothetical protein